MKNYYDVLGVAPHADQRVIRAAFKALAQVNHPDRVSEDDRDEADARMQEINEAFNVLSDPARRKHYDEQLQSPQKKAPVPQPVGYPPPYGSEPGTSLWTLCKKGIVLGVALLMSMVFAFEKKSIFERGWDFLSSGFSDSSTYAINWPLFLLIMGAGIWLSTRVGR